MKNKIILILILSISSLYSCEKALDETIYGKIAESNYWNTEKDAVAAIKSAYASIRGGWNGLSFWQFVVEDMGTETSTGGYFATTSYSSYTGWSATTPDFNSWGLWTPFWSGINYANAVLDNVPGMNIEEDVKNRITGEAYAVRAMIYFHLVNWFGGMPEVKTTKTAPLTIPRQTVESNYALIESDLKKAIDLLPLKSSLVALAEADYGRVSKGAAQALLAKVYLQQKKWQECADACSEIINSAEYILEPDYMDIFSLENEGFSNKEVIWVLPFITGTSPVINSCVLQVYLFKAGEIKTYSNYYNWSGDIRLTKNFYDSFESKDLRKKGLYYSASSSLADPVMLLKYPSDPASDGSQSGTDYPFIRYADVLLMHAEALANLSDLIGAATDINTVRRRAGLPNVDPLSFNKQTLLSHIYNERKWELYFEGHAKQDKIRMDYDNMINYIKSKSTDWQIFTAERYLLLPIPANAVASNPGLDQNPGFE
jgi:tetratricopeptide (TPR) repeat protein